MNNTQDAAESLAEGLFFDYIDFEETLQRAAEKKPPQLASLIDQLHALREEKRLLASKDKSITAEIEELESAVITALKKANCTSFKTTKAGASLTTQDIPIIEDITAFEQYVLDNKALYLLQRRLSSKACLELHQMGDTPAGISILVKDKIALRSI